MENGTRRLDVDTRWLKKLGINAAKDTITVQEYNRVRNHLEDKYTKVQIAGGEVCRDDIEIMVQGVQGSKVQGQTSNALRMSYWSDSQMNNFYSIVMTVIRF